MSNHLNNSLNNMRCFLGGTNSCPAVRSLFRGVNVLRPSEGSGEQCTLKYAMHVEPERIFQCNEERAMF